MRERLMFGRYIGNDSRIHRIDPRAKLIAMPLYLIMILLSDGSAEIVGVLSFSLLMMRLTKIPVSCYCQAVKPLRVLILFIFLFSLLLVKKGTILYAAGPVEIYTGGVERGFLYAFRMILFASFTAILTFTTPPSRLTHALEDVLRPLKTVGLSPERWSLMITIALRFIPTILDEAQVILKAQASRGADLKEQPFKEKAQMLIALLVPVTAGALRRAEELITSMRSRGYRLGAPRTRFHIYAWKHADTWFTAAFAITAVVLAF